LSVEPEAQRMGIGRGLVERVLRAAAARAEPFVVLEGSPRMYARFGFEPAADYGIERPSELIPEPAFQLVRLPSYRPELRGQVRYPDYFYEIGAVGP
jgi:putative acetyltransferase